MRVATGDIEQQLVQALSEVIWDEEIIAAPGLVLLDPTGLVITFQAEPGYEVTEDQMRVVRRRVAEGLREAPVVANAFTYDDLVDGSLEDDFALAFQRSFHRDRAADVIVRFREHYHFPSSIAANHGTPYGYDQEVPLIFMHPALSPAAVERAVETVDVAPTIASWLHIEPDDVDGVALAEVVRQQ